MLMPLLLVVLASTPDSAEMLLMRARAERDVSLLDAPLFDPATCSDLLLQELLLTLAQIGHSSSPARIASFFRQDNLRDTALFAYGELEGAPLEPLLAELEKCSGTARLLALEALSKLATPAQHDRVAQAWLALAEEDRARTVVFMFRVASEAVTQAVIAELDKPSLADGGYVYYLARTGAAVPSALKSRLLSAYAKDAAILMNAVRIKVSDQNRTGAQIAKLCSHPDVGVRVNALRALAQADPTLVAGAAMPRVTDPNPGVLREAITALLALGWDNIDHTLSTLTDDFSPSQLETMVARAEKDRLGRFLPLVADWREAPQPWKKVQAIRALGRAGDEESRKQLLQLCGHSDPVLRTNALGAIAQHGDFPERAGLLDQALASGDPLQMATALALAKPDDVNRLLELAQKTYSEIDFQYGLIDQLKDWQSKEARETTLRGLLSHPDYLVRLKAYNALGPELAGPRDQILEKHWAPHLNRELLEEATSLLRQKQPIYWDLQTSKGKISIELQGNYAPITVANILQLTRKGYFDQMTFHRVVPNFVVQAGDPRGDGNGGPGYAIPCEVNLLRYERGAVGMALAGKDTGGSQFFICHSAQPHLDGGYTVFGRVVAGMAIADLVEEGDLILKASLR